MSESIEPPEFYRFDFVSETVSVDEASRTVVFRLQPDPSRYEWREVEGEDCLYDKLDHLYIPRKLFENSAKDLIGLPLYSQRPAIENSTEYAQSRRDHILAALDNQTQLARVPIESMPWLESSPEGVHNFAFMSVDIVGSTTLAISIDDVVYAKLMRIMLTELSAAIPLFIGHVLKYTGDGMVAYFPAPSYLSKNDLAIDCALTMQKIMHMAINPALQERSYPALGLRIGLESGRASVVTLGDPSAKQEKDILGRVVNLACKIQTRAPVGGIALGEETLRALHNTWRAHCEPLDAGEAWPYLRGDKPYLLYRLKMDNGRLLGMESKSAE